MKKTNRKKNYLVASLAILFLAGAFVLTTGFTGRQGNRPPNIIVILLDDAGYADFGFMGAKDLQTPHLDALAAMSVRFTDAHVTASVCSPSRAGLLTGKYQQRFGYECNEGEGYSGLPASEQLLPQYLKAKGYATAAFGKWHLGFQPEQHPLNKGFDYYYGFLSGSRSYFFRPEKDDKPGSNRALLENKTPVSFEGYLTDVLGNKAADYIRGHKDQPFFMYWAPNAVHTPMEASEEDLKRFAGSPRPLLAAMTWALDRAVGTMMDELKKQGLYDNTLIFFLSDNGGAHDNQSGNYPLKGFKGNKYEGGHRIPFLVSWPHQIPGGRVFDGLSSSLDITATCLQAAGLPDKKTYGLDGISLLPYLNAEKSGDPHPELVWRKDFAAAIRVGDYKLVRVEQLGERMYNLKKDPGESTDLGARYPAVANRLRKKLRQWEQSKIRPLWSEGAVWDTITLMIHDDLMKNNAVRVKNPEQLRQFRNKKN